MYSDIVSREEIQKTLKNLEKKIKEVVGTKKLAGVDGIQTPRQLLFSRNNYFSDRETVMGEILLTHALRSEKTVPGSVDDFFSRIFSGDSSLKNAPIARASSVDMLGSTAFTSLNDRDRSLLMTALNHAGFAGKISVERSADFRTWVEVSFGYNFDVTSPFLRSPVLLDGAFILLIDGFIESVSEIDRLLNECHESGARIVLCVRGAADDVISTLKVNFDRRSLNVIPVIVKFDVDGINTIKDMAIACGAHIVSTNTGDLISTTTLARAARVDRCTVYGDHLSITHNGTMDAVRQHRAFLQKRAEEASAELAPLFITRIKSLTSSRVIIRLSNDSQFASRAEALDNAIRSYIYMVNHGTLDRRAPNHIVKSCIDSIMGLGSIIINNNLHENAQGLS